MKKPQLNGASFTENNFSLDSEIKDKLFSETKEIFVSFFNSVTDKAPKEISITEALADIKSDKLLSAIQKIRETESKGERDNLKRALPSITVSGTFKGGHAEKDLVHHSGLIQVDLDGVNEPEKLKEQISKDIFTFSTFISPSGNGVKAILKIPTENHSQSFEIVKSYFQSEYNASIDSKCKDIGRLMFLTYDNQIFINSNSLLMNPTTIKVKNVITEIENRKIDLTDNYNSWIKIAFAFANEFQESGRELFHSVSKISLKYDEIKCNEQFSKCLKGNSNKTNIGTFFHFAKLHGIDLRTHNNKDAVPEKEANEARKETNRFYQVEKYLNKIYDFRYNKVANEVENKSKNEVEFRPVVDNNLYRHLQLNGINFSMNNLSALLRSDFINEYDPIQNYFQELPPWDERTDYISELCKFIKVKDQERFNNHFKKMLVRSVSCGLGFSFNKQAFILIGDQNNGKTTFCRWLCPKQLEPYYQENIGTDKDSQISLIENFIIILDELETMYKAELNALKSMFSKDKVKIRRPYDRKTTTARRRANFFGSTNAIEFLNDETGSVRWLCFEIIGIDFDYKIKVDLDKVWSQAYALLKSGFNFELTKEERDENEKINSNHTIRTPEIELIQRYFEPIDKEKLGARHLTSTDIINELRGAGFTQIPLTPVKIGKALKFLDYVPVSMRKDSDKMPVKGYWVLFKKHELPTTLTTNS